MADFYQMQAEVIEYRKRPMNEIKPKNPRKVLPVSAKTIYYVFAVDRRWHHYSSPTMLAQDYSTLEAAQRAADSLSSVWEHRTIVKIDLPERGEK